LAIQRLRVLFKTFFDMNVIKLGIGEFIVFWSF